MGGARKIFPPRGKSKILKKNIIGRYFSGRLAAERGKREQSEGKTETPQKIAERDFLSFDFPDIRAFEA